MHKSWIGLGLVLVMGGCGGKNRACYPGESGNFDACFGLVSANDIIDPAEHKNDGDFTYPDRDDSRYSQPTAFLDLSVAAGNTAVAENFTLNEFATQSRGRYAIVQVHAVDSLQAVRDDLGTAIGVNSGYRSPGYNSTVPNSAQFSRHTYGDAFDLDPSGGTSLDALADACRATGSGFERLYATHVHCDWRDDALDDAFYGDSGGSQRAPEVTTSYRQVHDHPDELSAEAFDDVFADAWIERHGERLEAPAIGWPEGEPFREWTSFDAHGQPIEIVVAGTYVPPSHARMVQVDVGREVLRTIALD